MIGAMPAVSVHHERRKGQDKRHKRPSQLYIGGHWLPPTSPSPTPSPNGPHVAEICGLDVGDRFPEYYVCGKLSALQLIVGLILVGGIVLIVGLVQLVPNAADADHRFIFLTVGTGLLVSGLAMTTVRCACIHYRYYASTTGAVADNTAPSNMIASEGTENDTSGSDRRVLTETGQSERHPGVTTNDQLIALKLENSDTQVRPKAIGYILLKFQEDSVDRPLYFN